MKRILKIQEYTDVNSFDKCVRLAVFDENGNSLQGTINIEQLDAIEVDLFDQTQKNNYPEIPDNSNKFFVYNPDQQKPRVLYNTYEEAYKNAELIANKYDDCTVYVLEAVATFKKETKKIVKETIIVNGEVNYEDVSEKIPF